MIGGWSLSEVTSYYLLLSVAGSFLIAHIDESVAIEDIYEGGLVKYVIRPFSYFWDLFFGELSWRIFQGLIGIGILFIIGISFQLLISFVSSPLHIFMTFISFLLAYTLSFLFKMILGFSAFWLTEFRGIQSSAEIILLIFAGFIVPLQFLPTQIKEISFLLPFAYMVYFPILAIQGRLEYVELLGVLGMQILWIGFFACVYRLMWNRGIKLFTGVGQ